MSVFIFDGLNFVNPETKEIYNPIVKWFTGSEFLEATVDEFLEWKKQNGV